MIDWGLTLEAQCVQGPKRCSNSNSSRQLEIANRAFCTSLFQGLVPSLRSMAKPQGSLGAGEWIRNLGVGFAALSSSWDNKCGFRFRVSKCLNPFSPTEVLRCHTPGFAAAGQGKGQELKGFSTEASPRISPNSVSRPFDLLGFPLFPFALR